MEGIKITDLIAKMNLKNLTPDVELSERYITVPEFNRPALQLTGFFDGFYSKRIQLIGIVENFYLETLTKERKAEIYSHLLSYEDIPCLIYTTNIMPDEELLMLANEKNIPVLQTERRTSPFQEALIHWTGAQLAPAISIHGVLVDVYGVGVLLMGDSGVGKSEAALELIKRGHRLVTDDVVEIRKISDDTLVGSAPAITKHLIELRGIGIVDVKAMFGIQSVKETQTIDMVINLEEWDKDKTYDRMGLEDHYTEILGNSLICYEIPIRPGRNVAVIVETAAINHRQKQMGYNAAHELYRRVQENWTKNNR